MSNTRIIVALILPVTQGNPGPARACDATSALIMGHCIPLQAGTLAISTLSLALSAYAIYRVGKKDRTAEVSIEPIAPVNGRRSTKMTLTNTGQQRARNVDVAFWRDGTQISPYTQSLNPFPLVDGFDKKAPYDFTIDISPNELRGTKVLLTWTDGRRRFWGRRKRHQSTLDLPNLRADEL